MAEIRQFQSCIEVGSGKEASGSFCNSRFILQQKDSLKFSDEHIYEHLQNSRREQLLWVTGVAAVTVGLIAAMRLMVLGLENTIYIGPIAFCALTILLIFIRNGLPLRRASIYLIALTLVTAALLAYQSGGVNSYAIVLLPFIPMLTIILLDRKAAVVCAGICIVTIGILTYFASEAPGLVDAGLIGLDPTLARGLFLAILVVVSTVMAYHQSKVSDAMAATIWNHATYDYLTGLPNRRHLDATLERDFKIARRNKSHMAALLIDIDFFKEFNDSHGHLVGDECLRHVASTLAECLRRPSDIVGRFGGEEFLVLMPGTDSDGAQQVAESMRAAVENIKIENLSRFGNGKSQLVTISVGICCVAARSVSTENELVEGADRALYQAKTNGRNRVEIRTSLTDTSGATDSHSDYLLIDRAVS